MIYGDLHCDTFWRCYQERITPEHPNLQVRPRSDYRRLQTYAIYVGDHVRDPLPYFNAVYAYGTELFRRRGEMVLCRRAREIDEAFSAGKTPYLVSVEGGGFFSGKTVEDRKIVKELKKRGVCFLSLCYNKGNQLAGGILSPEKSLTEAGRNAALLLREEGISLDLSHLNRRSADALLEMLPDGVVATHSNCFSLCGHPRNLADDQILALKEKKGLMGINFYPPFLKAEGEASVRDVLAHLSYAEKLGAAGILSFGSDFDGINETPIGLRSSEDIPALAETLIAAKGKEAAENYLYRNFKNYLDRVFK